MAIVAILVGSLAIGRAEVPADLTASVDVLFPPSGAVLRPTLRAETTDKARWSIDPRFQVSDFTGGFQSIALPFKPLVKREELAAHFTSVWGPPIIIGTGKQATSTWLNPDGGVRVEIAPENVPATVKLTQIQPVETLFAPGPALVAEKLVAIGTPHDKIWSTSKIRVVFENKPRWAEAPRIQRTNWMTWPSETTVEVHLGKTGVVDGYRLSIPYDRHPPFAATVKTLMTKAWGKPQKRGTQLVFTGKRGTARATDTGTSWDLELLVR